MMQGAEATATGIMKFFSKDEVRRYLKSLVERYTSENQALGDYLGGLLRTLEQEKAAVKARPPEPSDSKDPKKQKDKGQAPRTSSRGWVKMGSLLVNISDPTGAMAETLFQLHEDVKARLAKSAEALKSFDELNSQTIPTAGLYFLQLRNGSPERLIADLSAARREVFAFNADFKLV